VGWGELIIVDDLRQRLLRAFAERFGGTPDLIARAPGRVNLIGEHTDYNDGFVLPMAIGCETMVAARPNGDGEVRAFAADLGGLETRFAVPGEIQPDIAPSWSNYVRGVADSLQRAGVSIPGADLVIMGIVPKGAGLSSSASLEVAVGLAFAALAGQPEYDRTSIALAGQRAEREFAGCNCGIMDQLVSAHAIQDHAMLLDCRSLEVTHTKMPDHMTVMIVHSGIERGLVDGEYNMRRAQCEAAARHYGVPALRDIDLPGLEDGRQSLDPLVYRRARHVVSENQRTRLAANALARGQLVELGQLMAQSQLSMQEDFAITTPKIDNLVALLQSAIGAEGGARMTGGGFGGAVVAILPKHILSLVRNSIESHYRTPAGNPPVIMVEQAHHGASLIRL
jgi:galactokinase